MSNEPYFKLAKWDERFCVFRGTSRECFETEALARTAAKRPGLYRIDKMIQDGQESGEPFEVTGTEPAKTARFPKQTGIPIRR